MRQLGAEDQRLQARDHRVAAEDGHEPGHAGRRQQADAVAAAHAQRREIRDRARVGLTELGPRGAQLRHAHVPGAQRALDAGALLAEVASAGRAPGSRAARARPEREAHVPLGVRAELERERRAPIPRRQRGARAAHVRRELACRDRAAARPAASAATSSTGGGRAAASSGSPSAKSWCLIERMSAKSEASSTASSTVIASPARLVTTMCSWRSSVTKRSLRISSSSARRPPASGLRRKKAAAKYSTLPAESGIGRSPLMRSGEPREKARVVRIEAVRALADRAVVGADAEGRSVEDCQGHHHPGCLRDGREGWRSPPGGHHRVCGARTPGPGRPCIGCARAGSCLAAAGGRRRAPVAPSPDPASDCGRRCGPRSACPPSAAAGCAPGAGHVWSLRRTAHAHRPSPDEPHGDVAMIRALTTLAGLACAAALLLLVPDTGSAEGGGLWKRAALLAAAGLVAGVFYQLGGIRRPGVRLNVPHAHRRVPALDGAGRRDLRPALGHAGVADRPRARRPPRQRAHALVGVVPDPRLHERTAARIRARRAVVVQEPVRAQARRSATVEHVRGSPSRTQRAARPSGRPAEPVSDLSRARNAVPSRRVGAGLRRVRGEHLLGDGVDAPPRVAGKPAQLVEGGRRRRCRRGP